MSQMVKSRKVTILATLLNSGHSGQKGRVGPPESVEKPGKAGKAGKGWKTRFLRVQGPLAGVYQMRGSEGSWSPQNVVAGQARLSVQGLSRPFTHAGFRGLLEPSERSRCLDGTSVSRAFPGPGPGPCRAQLCMHRVREQAPGRVGVVGARLETGTSWRSLGNPRDGPGAIEGPRPLPVCGFPAFVSRSCKQLRDRGPCKHGPSMHA